MNIILLDKTCPIHFRIYASKAQIFNHFPRNPFTDISFASRLLIMMAVKQNSQVENREIRLSFLELQTSQNCLRIVAFDFPPCLQVFFSDAPNSLLIH